MSRELCKRRKQVYQHPMGHICHKSPANKVRSSIHLKHMGDYYLRAKSIMYITQKGNDATIIFVALCDGSANASIASPTCIVHSFQRWLTTEKSNPVSLKMAFKKA